MREIRLTLIELIVILIIISTLIYIGFPIYKTIECKISFNKNSYWSIQQKECKNILITTK